MYQRGAKRLKLVQQSFKASDIAASKADERGVQSAPCTYLEPCKADVCDDTQTQENAAEIAKWTVAHCRCTRGTQAGVRDCHKSHPHTAGCTEGRGHALG